MSLIHVIDDTKQRNLYNTTQRNATQQNATQHTIQYVAICH